MVGGNEWEAAFQKAKALVGKMTLEEKVRGGYKRLRCRLQMNPIFDLILG